MLVSLKKVTHLHVRVNMKLYNWKKSPTDYNQIPSEFIIIIFNSSSDKKFNKDWNLTHFMNKERFSSV